MITIIESQSCKIKGLDWTLQNLLTDLKENKRNIRTITIFYKEKVPIVLEDHEDKELVFRIIDSVLVKIYDVKENETTMYNLYETDDLDDYIIEYDNKPSEAYASVGEFYNRTEAQIMMEQILEELESKKKREYNEIE